MRSFGGIPGRGKQPQGCADGGSRGLSACWRGNGPPRRRRVAGLRGWPATLGLRHGPDSYGRQQWGILRNGRKADAATRSEEHTSELQSLAYLVCRLLLEKKKKKKKSEHAADNE